MSGSSSERERSCKQAKSAAQNPLHHENIESKKLKIYVKNYHEIVSVNSLLYFVCCVEKKSDYLAKKHHFNCPALWSGYVKCSNYK